MHLLVLSAFRQEKGLTQYLPNEESQCTFWCSVLSDEHLKGVEKRMSRGLNAPFGAQCFPTVGRRLRAIVLVRSQCTFWCSVLSDRGYNVPMPDVEESQCTFWCSVLSDKAGTDPDGKLDHQASQCTFWCSVLSDDGLEWASTHAAMSQCTFWCSVLSDNRKGLS